MLPGCPRHGPWSDAFCLSPATWFGRAAVSVCGFSSAGSADEVRWVQDDLTEAIENAREARSQHNDDTKSIREEMQQLRTKSNQIAAERDGLVDQLKKNTDGTRALETQAAKLRKELKVQDSAQIDKVIKEMTEKLETSSMDLKSEKTLVNEIKNITAQKEQLKEWEEVKAKIEARKQANDVLYKKRQEVGEKLTASREAEKAINVKLDSFKSGDGTADGVAPHTKMMELMDQKTKVIGEFSLALSPGSCCCYFFPSPARLSVTSSPLPLSDWFSPVGRGHQGQAPGAQGCLHPVPLQGRRVPRVPEGCAGLRAQG